MTDSKPSRASGSSSPAAVKRPHWTKFHLIYFALAAIDILAVSAGLWLSNHTKTQFEVSVSKIEVAGLMRDNAVATLGAALRLMGPANQVFEHKNPVKAQADFTAASAEFDKSILTDHVGSDAEQRMKKAAAKAAGGPTLSEHKHGGLGVWFPEAHSEFESIEGTVAIAKAEIAKRSDAAFAAYAKGDFDQATRHMEASEAAFVRLLEGLRDWIALADQLNDKIVDQSLASLRFGELLQYAIGAAILLMVAMVVIYAHFMGRLLRRKFEEIELANDTSRQFADRLMLVNGDVGNLNIQLSENMKRLSQAQDDILKRGRMEQLGHLTATVAHELRNPLGAVRTSAFLLERKIKGKGYGLEPQIQRINNGIVRCDDIITQLLDFSRSAVAAKEPVDLDGWLQKLLEDEVQKLPAAVEVELAPGLGSREVAIDGARLSRAVINLLSNASEAMVGKGDDPAKFATAKPKIEIATRLTHRGAEITVRDNGPGIKREDHQRIMEPLFTTKSFGTGLGLPAVQRILDQHDGGLEIDSEPGQGAIFTLWIPLSGGAREAA